MPSSRRALIPFLGYREFLKAEVEFFGSYNPDFRISRPIIFENTGLYFILGGMVTFLGVLYPAEFLLALVVVYLFLLSAALFEVDLMIAHPTWFWGWQYWKAIPIEVAKSKGRVLVALGMYQAILFFLAGLAASHILVYLA